MIGIVVIYGTSHCTEQNRRGRKTGLQHVGRERIIERGQRRSADVLVRELKLMAECVCNGLEDEDGLFSDFRADAVAGEDGEIQKHAEISLVEKCFFSARSSQTPAAEGGYPHMNCAS